MTRWIALLLLALAAAGYSGAARAGTCPTNYTFFGFECTDWQAAKAGAVAGISPETWGYYRHQQDCDAAFGAGKSVWMKSWLGPAIPNEYGGPPFFTAYRGCYAPGRGPGQVPPNELIIFGSEYSEWSFPKDTYEPELDPDRNRGPCPHKSSCYGDPINAGTGNKYEVKTEYRGSGQNPLEFSWTYNSVEPASVHASSDEILGTHRTTFYDRRVRVETVDNVTRASITRPNGNVVFFTASSSGWVAETTIDGNFYTRLGGSGQLIGYQYLTPEKNVELFDANGLLQSITDMFENSLALGYDASARIESVSDSFGRKLGFIYNPNGRLARLNLPDGNVVLFTYDIDDNLSSVEHVGAGRTTYLYNESSHTSGAWLPHALTGEVDGNNARHSTTEYDAQGRAVGTYLGAGVDRYSAVYTTSWTGNYNATAAVTTPSGRVRTLQMRPVNLNGGQVVATGYTDTCPGCVTRSKKFTYDPTGHLNVTTDVDNVVTDQDYDSNGNRTQVVRAKGTSQAQTEYTVWESSRTPMPLQIVRSGQTRDYTYNTRHQPLTAAITDTATQATRKTTYTYCEQGGFDTGSCPKLGLLLTADGPRTDVSDVTTYQYYASDDPGCLLDPVYCPHRKGDLQSVTDALGKTTQYLAYDGAGRVLSIRDPNGVVTDNAYSPLGAMTSTKARGGDNSTEADDAVTLFEYDAAGQLIRTTLPDGSASVFVYDAAHRLTDVRDGLGNFVHYTLDGAGHRIAEETRDASGALRRNLSRVFNSLGLVQTYADAQSTPTDFTYDALGATDTVRDPLNRIADYDFDPLRRLSRVTENSTGLANERAVRAYAYDLRDNLLSITDPKGLVTTYTYDGLDNLTKQVSPDSGTTTLTYDAAGNKKTVTDSRGKVMSFSWDALNRKTAQTVPTAAQNVYFDYDQPAVDCATGETFGAGRLARVRDESGSTRWCYDRRGNVVRRVQTVTGGSTLTTGASYNGANRLVAMTYPSGAIVVYGRNANGQIVNIGAVPKAGAAQVTLVSNVAYLPYGPLASMTFGNGRKLTKAYDANYDIDKIDDSAPVGAYNLDASIDAVGNLTSLTEQVGSSPVSRTIEYDGLDRMKAFKNGAALLEGYVYDPTGNRTSKTAGTTTEAYTYAASSHRLINVGKNARTTDANGNTNLIGTASKGTVLTFDDRNRLRDAKVANKLVANYRYNGNGERVLKIDAVMAANSRQYVYDEAGHLLGIYTTAGARVQEFVWLDDLVVAVLSDHDGSTFQYVETDHLGSPRVVVHPAKNTIVWRWQNTGSGFGEHLPVEDADGNGLAYSLALRFPGQLYDSETKLSYNMNRTYDPTVGRYLESDPIGLSGGMSTYGYALQNPARFNDPSGLKVSWQGFMLGGSGGEGFVAGAYAFVLNSDCVGEKEAYAGIFAMGGGAGFGFKIPNWKMFSKLPKQLDASGGGSSVSLHDWTMQPDPNTLQGSFGMWSDGIAAIKGKSIGSIRMGDAFSDGLLSTTYGFEFGAQVIMGFAVLTDQAVHDCKKCETK